MPALEWRFAIIHADGSVGLDDQLQIHAIAQARLQVDGRDGKAFHADVLPLRVVAVVGMVEDVHLDLEMAGIDRVGAFGLVRPVSAHLAHEFARRGIEEMVSALVRFRRRYSSHEDQHPR